MPDGEEVEGGVVLRPGPAGRPRTAPHPPRSRRKGGANIVPQLPGPTKSGSDTVTDFWTFGGANSTGTCIMTVLGCILMVASIVGWVIMEKRKLEHQAAAALRASGAFDAPSPPAASAGE